MSGARVAVLLFVLVGALHVGPALLPLNHHGLWNWNAFCGAEQAEVTSLLRYGQFPLWNPWRAGGVVAFAEPQSTFLTPVTPLALLFGVMPAFKLLFLPTIVAGCLGFWLLAGRLGLTGAARLVPPLLVFGSSVPTQFIVNGLPHWLFGLALLPWLLLAVDLASDDARHVLTAGLAWAAVLWCGDIFHFVYDILAVALWVAARALDRRSVRPLLVAAAAGLTGLCFAAVRLRPLFDVYATYPREGGAGTGHLTPWVLLRVLVDPSLAALRQPSGALAVGGLTVDWFDTAACLGPLALLAALAAVRRGRRALAPLLVAGAFAWVACGPSAWPDLAALLARVPVFASMRLPERLGLYVLVGLALAAGLGVDVLRPRWRSAAAALVVLGCLVPAAITVLPLARAAFPLAPSETSATSEPPAAFHQEAVVEPEGSWSFGPDQQALVLRNVGDVIGHHDVPVPGRVRAVGSPLYRGEFWLRGGHGNAQADITPQAVRVRAELDADDVLLLNQNWFPGWTATGTVEGPLHAEDGLPAIGLPAGRHELELRFTQPSVMLGALLTLGALGLAALYVATTRGPVTRCGRREVAVLGGFALLAFVQGLPRARHATEAASVPLPRKLLAEPGTDPQALIDAATPGDELDLSSGTWPGFRITRGLVVVVRDDGAARLTSPLVIEGLPSGERVVLPGGVEAPQLRVRDCAGPVLLQDTQLGGLQVAWSDQVQLFGGAVAGAVRVEHAVLGVERARLAGDVTAEHALLLLGDTQLGRLDLCASQLVAESDGEDVWASLSLREGSSATLGGAGRPVAQAVDASSRLQLAEAAPPRLRQVSLAPGGQLRVRLCGTPGDSAILVAGTGLMLRPQFGREANYARVDMSGRSAVRPVRLTTDGTLDLLFSPPSVAHDAGGGFFLQLVAERPPGLPRVDLSLMDGVLFRPQDGAPP